MLCLACHALCGSLLWAQADSTHTNNPYAIGEVVVTGTRNQTDLRHLPLTVSVVSRQQIEQTHNPSLLPVLTEQVPGLFTTARGIMGFGVSDGAAGSISLRGMSGGAARLMVLIDGHPQYMGLFGHPIADAYQSFLAERVEVVRGPASVLYGSNAMGGVVNIVTRKMNRDGVTTHASVGNGSFNSFQAEATNQVRKGRLTSTVSASYNRTDGHRERMDFEQYGGYAKLGYMLSGAWSMGADLSLTHFNGSNPGSVSTPLLEARQRITRGMASAFIDNDYDRTSGRLSLFYNWGRHRINDGYSPTEGEAPLDYRFNSKDNMMGISWYQNTRLFAGNLLTVGFDWYRFGGDAWNKYVEGIRSGELETLKGMPRTENEVAGYIDFRQDIGRWLTIDAGLRADHHSQAGNQWIPQAGFSFRLPGNAGIKLSASRGFRYPIIREMFMWGVANPELEAESMWNYELSYAQTLLKGRLKYAVNVFLLDADNLITTDMVNGRRMNVNTGEASNAGVEATIAYRFNTAWTVDGNYSYLHMDNPIVASPQHKMYVGAAWRKGRWALSTGLQYIGGLYTTTGADAQTEEFWLWNLRGAYQANRWLSIWARGENLLAQQYEINAGFPMPRVTAIGGVSIRF